MSIKVFCGATPQIDHIERKEKIMNYYVMRPDLTPYEGIKVTKETSIEYENERVKQSIKDLKLISKYVFKNEKYTSTNILEVNLEEGEVLLFENENRGYFLPKDVPICEIKTAIEDYKSLALALDGEENDTKGNENKDI